MDINPSGTFEYGLYPAFGYFNESNEYPAMSNRPSSWPANGWPSIGRDTKWPGEWDGRFGRGVIYVAAMHGYLTQGAATVVINPPITMGGAAGRILDEQLIR